MKSFTEIAGMGEYRKKKGSSKTIKKKKKVIGNKGTKSQLDASKPKSSLIMKKTKPKAVAKPKVVTKPKVTDAKPRNFAPRLKQKTKPKMDINPKSQLGASKPRTSSIMSKTKKAPTTSSFMGKQKRGKITKTERDFLRKRKAEQMKKTFKTKGEMDRHRKKYDVKLMKPTLSQRLKKGKFGPKTAKEMKQYTK